MDPPEIGRARTNALLTNGVITAGFVGLMLCAGLWPFTFAPSNNVSFDKKAGGISFLRPAAVYDADTLNAAERTELAESTVTIAIRVSPSSESPWFISQIVSCTDGNRLCAVVGQWKSHLVLKTFPDRTAVGNGPKREVAVRDILNAGTARTIVIVTGPRGTRIFVDKQESLNDEDFRLFSGGTRGPLRFALGGSLSGKYTWNGTLSCFALFTGDASVRLMSNASAAPCPACAGREEGEIIGYSFEKPDSLARNCSGVRHALVIRSRFPIIGGNVLVPFWDDFTNDASYYSDIAVNLLGFIPFGFFLARFLSQVNGMGRRRVVAAVVAAGFVLSLGIELSQVFLPGRSSQLSDLICNTIGSFAGAHLCFRLSLFHPRQPARK
jgi:hypothetical protein